MYIILEPTRRKAQGEAVAFHRLEHNLTIVLESLLLASERRTIDSHALDRGLAHLAICHIGDFLEAPLDATFHAARSPEEFLPLNGSSATHFRWQWRLFETDVSIVLFGCIDH